MKMEAPSYRFQVYNRHGIPASDWQMESQQRLAMIAQSAGARIAAGFLAAQNRSQLNAVIDALATFNCRIGEYHEYIVGTSETVALESLDRYGDQGWEFTVRWDEHNFETGAWDVRRANYRTDRWGDGLWVSLPSGDWKQLEGTCQYSLPAGEKAARKALMERL